MKSSHRQDDLLPILYCFGAEYSPAVMPPPQPQKHVALSQGVLGMMVRRWMEKDVSKAKRRGYGVNPSGRKGKVGAERAGGKELGVE